ncbi:nucleotidyltransferase domain-containing protein [Hydrogenophaga sp. BPS33]|uniref:nucleotidyltransferase domain-containing protein n=1 Tax=Hydrogenophaga sp. BPS33 TaxID=2651974 RepID=UPI00131F54EF|nr:nucleotidyltransferase family protein [Hydrogenophaga sp. BPS33]QHE86391.1 nucleotidyltransferase family protein [Hydrogenophaga sp. BPS33]
MTLPKIEMLVAALKQPASLGALDPNEWDLLVRQARQADLLARIGRLAQDEGHWDALPLAPRRHLASAMNLAARQQTELRYEVLEIAQVLESIGVPVVLLKGAAYAMAGLDASRGRMVSDVDILVPRERLPEVESALMVGGWVSTNRDAYDQRYYRTSMHELPPLKHMKRGTVLDVHHAIMPLTARLKPDANLLLRSARAPGNDARILVLAPVDMVLHSAAHLFHEGDLELGLRGLVDLDALLREFAAAPDFWRELIGRARALQLDWPLHQALRYTGMLLGTETPSHVTQALLTSPGVQIAPWRQRALDALFLRALRPAHASAADRWTSTARFLLYLRGHWLRMPPAKLTWHLMRKLVKSAYSTPAEAK